MLKTKERYIPEGFKEFAPELGDYPKGMFACYVNLEQPHNPRAIFFIGKQSKHAWYYRFANIPQMKERIKKSISSLMTHEETKEKRKAERKEKLKSMDTSSVVVGDIYHSVAGYNCTRNEYVKVKERIGKNKVAVVELSKYQVDGDWMNGNVAPVLDSESGKITILTIRPGYRESVVLRNSKSSYHNYFSKWSGQPNWENCD